MVNIIAYTYEADYHCIDCAFQRHGNRAVLVSDLDKRVFDENNILYNSIDSEGNPIHPVFSTDELPCHISKEAGGYSPVTCGDCHEVIATGNMGE